jgi:hypothetical protein
MNNLEVSDTGVGMQSNKQRAAAGNKFMTKRERIAARKAKVVGPKKAKKPKKRKTVEIPAPPPPSPPEEEELGLVGKMV